MSDWKKRVIITFSIPVWFILWTFVKTKVKTSPAMEKILADNPLYAVAAALVVAELPLTIACAAIWGWLIGVSVLVIGALL